MRALAFTIGALASSGCLFVPNIAQHGYVACTGDADCEPGRTCELREETGICAPPPWHDETFGHRRVVVVTNEGKAAMPAGTAVPIVIGGEGERAGPLSLDEVGPDFRFADFDPATRTWSVRAVHLDRESDRFTAWIPTAREVLQGRSDVLAWLESNSFDGLPAVTEDPKGAFTVFEGFDNDVLPDEWLVRGTGGEPTVNDGVLNVGDNESLVLDRPLTPPVHVTALARVNGVNCTEVFVGFSGDEDAAFALPPAAGLFIDDAGGDLTGVALIGPVPADDGGQLEQRGGIPVGGALMRVSVGIDGAGVRVSADDAVVLDETALVPAFPADPLFFSIHVGGACSLDVDALWITPLPLPLPSVTVGPLVELAL